MPANLRSRLHCSFLSIAAVLLPAFATSAAAAAAPAYNHDMSAYEVLTKEAVKLVDANDMKGALKKAREVEEKWDGNTKDLKKADPSLWNLIDKQMDVAIEALQGTDAKKATAELNAFLEKLGRVPQAKK